MLPRVQGLRWSASTTCRGRSKLGAVPTARQFSSVPGTAPRAFMRRPRIHTQNASLCVHQSRSISWTGWWSSKPASPEVAPPSEQSATLDATPILDEKSPVRASHATADTPDPSLPSAPAEVKPDIIEKIEDAVLAPNHELADAADISQIPERIGYLSEVCGLTYWYGPTITLQWTMEYIHIWGGLPWAATILATALLVRAFTARWILKAQRSGAKMREINPYLAPLRAEYQQAMYKQDKREQMRIGSEMRQLQRESGFNMLDAFKPILVQVPLTFGGFRCLRNACELPVPSMESESFLWVDSLTGNDPYILPLLIGALTYRTMSKSMKQSPMQGPASGMMLGFKYILPVTSVIFCHYQFLAAQLWFLAMTSLSQVQLTLLGNQGFRNRFDLGPVPTPQNTSQPASDAFGYPMPSEVAGMRIQNKGEVVDIKARPVPGTESQANVSSIDKAIDSLKSKISMPKDIKENMQTHQRTNEKSQEQRRLDKYEYEAQQNRKRMAGRQSRKGKTEYVESQVGGMNIKQKKS